MLQVLPQFFIAPVAGVLNDRVSRRKLMILTDLARAMIVLGMLAASAAGMVWTIYALLVCESFMWGFFEPEQGLRSLFAEGDIRITQAAREAEGDRAKLNLPQGDIILVGDPARVIDKQEGRTTQGLRLTLFAENDRILIENEDKPMK